MDKYLSYTEPGGVGGIEHSHQLASLPLKHTHAPSPGDVAYLFIINCYSFHLQIKILYSLTPLLGIWCIFSPLSSWTESQDQGGSLLSFSDEKAEAPQDCRCIAQDRSFYFQSPMSLSLGLSLSGKQHIVGFLKHSIWHSSNKFNPFMFIWFLNKLGLGLASFKFPCLLHFLSFLLVCFYVCGFSPPQSIFLLPVCLEFLYFIHLVVTFESWYTIFIFKKSKVK